MSPTHPPGETLDPGLLVRHLHGELGPGEAREIDGHLVGCPACRALRESLQATERRLGQTLRRTDPRLPDDGRWANTGRRLRRVREGGTLTGEGSRPSRRALAAGIALAFVALATAGVASEPLRSWIADGWARLTPPPAAVEDGPREPGRASIRVETAGPILAVSLDHLQLRGTLRVVFAEGTGSTLTVVEGDAERLAVGRDRVRISNAPASRASYRLAVSAAVERVRVEIGNEAPVELVREPGVDALVVDLRDRTVVRDPAARDEG